MNSKIIWKLVLSAFVLAWSVYYLVPFEDTVFKDYLRGQATARQDELDALLAKAETQVEQAAALDQKLKQEQAAAAAAGTPFLPNAADQEFVRRHRTLFLALRSLGEDENLDYYQFYPHLKIGGVKNVKRRNALILSHLLEASKSRVKYGLDLQGGVGFTLTVKANEAAQGPDGEFMREQQVGKAIDVLRERIDGLGVSEPVIRPVGDTAIEVQLPGVNTRDNPETIDVLKKPAKLEFRMVFRGDPALIPPDRHPFGYTLMIEESEDKDGNVIERPTLVSDRTAAPGSIVKASTPVRGENGLPEISLEFTAEGARVFEELTRQISADNTSNDIGRLAIVLDGKLYSAPTVKESIGGGHARIFGNFSPSEATELANVLNNPLEEELVVDEMYEIGPTLAAESKASSVRAALLGAGLVVVFMLLIYRVAGLLSVVTLALNVIVVVGVQASVMATLTLPGVAALVLTIGMAVDANILIYERMREEFRAGKSLPAALEAGFERALSSILDSNLTTLLTAFILLWLGTGPVKGFGVIMAIGLIANLFCVLIFNHALLELVIGNGWVKRMKFTSLVPETRFSFFACRRAAFAVSGVALLVGGWAIFSRGQEALGIDFRGGEVATVKFVQALPPADIAAAAAATGAGPVKSAVQTALGTGDQLLKIETETGQSQKLLAALSAAHPDAGLELIGTTVIGPTVSQTLVRNALLAVALALVGVLLYVAVRFEIGYAIGAIAATIHDVLITIGIFVLLGGQFDAPMVAAVLMIIGYSLNDTVIVFDRVREELKLHPQLPLVQVLDLAVNRTLSRTTLTSATTFLAALALFLFGAGVVREFAMVFMIGIATGTLSSIFIANPVFCWWHKGDRKHVEAHEFLPKHEWEVSTRAAR